MTLSSWNTEVDAVPPTITLPVYTNATAKNSASTLPLNVLVSDAGSGITGSACIMNINGGTNQTIAVSSGWCNNTLSLTGLSNGNNVVNVYANDSVNNTGLNNSFVVLMDSSTPAVSASCSPSSLSPGQNVTCTCSGSALSGVASSTPTSTITTVPGAYSYSCSVTINSGNVATTTASYSVIGYSGPGYIPVSSSSPSGMGNTFVNNTNQNVPPVSQENNSSSASTQPTQSSSWIVNVWNAIVNWFSHIF